MSGSTPDPATPPSQEWTGDTVVQGWTGDTVVQGWTGDTVAQGGADPEGISTHPIPSYQPDTVASPPQAVTPASPSREFQRTSAPDQQQRFLGTCIGEGGRYRIEQHLGGGGMGEVYQAADTTLGRQVAVKILTTCTSGEDLINQSLIKRFQREVAVCAPLTHPNVVQVTDMDLTPEGLPFYVMEYLQGQTLGQVMEQEGPLDLERVLRILIQVCEGLKGAHHNGVVHRDLKPDNVFLIPGVLGEWVKILDFGIAKVIREDRPDQTQLTGMGYFVGTYRYASPEQCLEGMPIDQRTDIYSLGAVMYEMISGTNPFGITDDSARSTYRWLESHVRVKPYPLRQHPDCRGVPPLLEQAVMRCLEKVAEDRFPSIDELEQCLKQILYDIAPPTSPLIDRVRRMPSPPAAAPPQPRLTSTPHMSAPSSEPSTPHEKTNVVESRSQRRFPGILILLGIGGCLTLALWLRDRFWPQPQPDPPPATESSLSAPDP